MKYQAKEEFLVSKCLRKKYRKEASNINRRAFKFKVNEGATVTVNKLIDEQGDDFLRICYGDRVGMTYDHSILNKLRRTL